jgi:hypothetical protein
MRYRQYEGMRGMPWLGQLPWHRDVRRLKSSAAHVVEQPNDTPLRTIDEIAADILAVEREAEGLLDGLLVRRTT